MTLNIGRTDRRFRLAAAAVLALAAVFVTEGTRSGVLGAVELVLVVTSMVGTCPVYLPFGVSTVEHT